MDKEGSVVVPVSPEAKKEFQRTKKKLRTEIDNQQADRRKDMKDEVVAQTIEEVLADCTEVIACWPDEVRNLVEDHVLPLPADVLCKSVPEALGSILYRAKKALHKQELEATRAAGVISAKEMGSAQAAKKTKFSAQIEAIKAQCYEKTQERERKIIAIKRSHDEAAAKEINSLSSVYDGVLAPLRADLDQLRAEAQSAIDAVEVRHEERVKAIQEDNLRLNGTIDALILIHTEKR